MAKKTASKTKPAAVQQTVKFAKGGFYQDLGGDLWFCTNAKQKKTGDDHVVMMQQTEDGQPVGDATEQLVGSFNKQLTAADLKEYRAVCQREREAEGKGGSETEPATGSIRKSKAKKEKAATGQPNEDERPGRRRKSAGRIGRTDGHEGNDRRDVGQGILD